uniref:Disintegrin domain-containing protein n=1 Tax=Meloidogyne hapla TaxID=6305 RepID=A0A1I8BH62_MELHA
PPTPCIPSPTDPNKLVCPSPDCQRDEDCLTFGCNQQTKKCNEFIEKS